MRPQDPRRRRPRSRCHHRPSVEGLETRELPSAALSASVSAGVGSPRRHDAAVVARPDSPSGLLGKKAPGPFLDPKVIRQAADNLYHADVPPGTPTNREIHRQIFTAKWIGKYTIGSPRFSDRASTIHLYGVSGGSNQFLMGKFQIALFPPADPAATPTPGNPFANQITGVADLFTQNYLQSGGMVVLDLNSTPGAGTSPDALPTQMSWSYDSNTSAGPYAAPGGVLPGSGYTQGAGVVDFKWIPDAHAEPGTRGSGTVIVTFQGLIHTSGVVSGVSKFIS